MGCKIAFALLVISQLSLILPSALGAVDGLINCEDLSPELCAFSISYSSKRCVLESIESKYECRTSEVVVDKLSNLIESDECINACGVDRNMVGISSDALLESQLVEKLCSQQCLQTCANIVDLYFNLAAAEGVFLPDLCESEHDHPHRAMRQLRSRGQADYAPASAPAPGPMYH